MKEVFRRRMQKKYQRKELKVKCEFSEFEEREYIVLILPTIYSSLIGVGALQFYYE